MATDTDWRPIDTAPRDDSSVLVCDDRTQDGHHQVVFWDETGYGDGPGWSTSDGPTFHHGAFTHWMPLPAPPVTT